MRRLPTRTDGRSLCLVPSILLLLGLGLVGACLAGAGASLDVVAAKSVPITGAVPRRTATAPLVVTDHVGSALRCQREPPVISPPDTMDRAPREDDARVYLSKMATWRSPQNLTPLTALDPYQASLHLTLDVGRFTIAATSGDHSLTRDPPIHRC